MSSVTNSRAALVPFFLCLKMNVMQCGLVLLFVASALAQNDLEVNCNKGEIIVKWRPRLNWPHKLEPSNAHLGDCLPSRLNENEEVLVFSVWLDDCGFRRQEKEDKVTYSNVLTYGLGPGLPPLVELVQCVYEESYKRTDSEDIKKNLVFKMEFMNSDFSGPAASSVFMLGSSISVRAQVVPQGQIPMQVYQIHLQHCVVATTPEVTPASQVHVIISNSGCLTESKEGNAAFLKRDKPSEILFYFQAFKFALEENLFIHCDIAAWPPQSFRMDEKSCNYVKEEQRWELLDDPSQSYICTCCDSTCILRTNFGPGTVFLNITQQLFAFSKGMSVSKVLGPFKIVEESSWTNMSDRQTFWDDEEGLGGVPVWLVALTVSLVLLVVSAAVAAGYYLCFWRGGRLGYRPSRDLLTKY